MIISHITLGTNDQDRAAHFYDAVLATIGIYRLEKPPELPLAYQHKDGGSTLFVGPPFNDDPATFGNGTHVALQAASRDDVHAFHQAAMANGGSDEGQPGLRPQYGDNYYAAYVRDPDGNKLQAVCYKNA